MSMYRKLTTVAAVAALTLGLAACGGGGSSPTTDNQDQNQQDDMMPPAPTPVAVTVPDAMYLDDENMPMAGKLMIAAGAMETSGGVTFLCAEGGDACEVTVADDGSVTATGGTVTASLTAAAMTQVATAKEMKADDEADMAQMARDRAIGQSAALSTGGNWQAGRTAPDPAASTGVEDIMISHPAGKAVSVRLTGYTAAETQPATLGSFTGAALTNTSSATVTRHLTVYTDMAQPKLAQFFDYDGSAATPSVWDAGTLTRPADDVLPITGSGNEGRFTAGNIDLTIFPVKAATASGGDTPKRFKANYDSNNDGTANQVRLPGKFDGASGHYVCATPTANYCTVTVSAAGTYTTTEDWTFTPIDGATAYREDAEFLTFGWWMSEPAKSTGAYSFAAFHNGSAYLAADSGTGVAGSATYTGNAAGRYVMGDDAGAFTANASLSAKFGTGTEEGSISGTISGFQGDADMSGWSVELKKIDILAANGLAGAFTSDTTVTDPTETGYEGTIATLGDTMAYGTWSGQFYGNERNPPADGGGNKVNAAPLAVGGQFDAHATGASISGAFGARR